MFHITLMLFWEEIKMKKVLNTVIAFMLSIIIICSTAGCNSSNKDIKNLMTEFEQACNTLNFDEVLNCINPKIADKIKIAVGFMGTLTDTDSEEIFEGLAEYISSDDISDTDFFSSISIDIKDIIIEDDAATVYTILTYEIEGEEIIRESTFNCIYYAEKWYISSFSMD